MTWIGHASDMDYLRLYAIGVGSLLAGAAVVHHIYKPDLVWLQARKHMRTSGSL